MLYSQVLDYAKRENIQVEKDFELKKIHWIIQLDKDGKVSGKALSKEEKIEENGKTRCVVKPIMVPYTDPNYISIPTDPQYYFLIGQSKVLLDGGDSRANMDKLKYTKNILNLLKGNRLVFSLLSFLSNNKERKKALEDLTEQKMKPTDWITFFVDGELLVNNEELKAFWRDYRKQTSKNDITNRLCYLTGQIKPCVDKFTKISTLPKLGPVDLVGLGQDSFTHYGLENITIGADEDNLIKWGLYDLCDKGVCCHDIVYIGWTKDKVNECVGLDLLNWTDQDTGIKMIKSLFEGKEYDVMDQNVYYLYGISVRSGRLVIVEQHTLSLAKVQSNIKKWFSKMGNIKYLIYRLTKCLEKQNDSDGMKENIWRNYYRKFIRCAILDQPIPKEIWNRALELELMSLLKNENEDGVRVALLKLCGENSYDTNSISYKIGVLFGKYSNIHRFSLVASGTRSKVSTSVEGMLCGIYNRPKYYYDIIKNRFDMLKLPYIKKIDEKFQYKGSKLYKEVGALSCEVPDRFSSNEETTNFLLGFGDTDRQRNSR